MERRGGRGKTRTSRGERGFTLVELMVVVLLLGFVFLLTLVFALISVRLEAVEERWIYFSYDINLAGVKYYYDSHTITRLSEDKVSVWLKIASSYEERLLQTEISCPSGMFRIVEGPRNFWGNKSKTSSVARGWVVIFPNSEVYLLSKIVCKNGDISK